ncbi:subtilisin-like protease SBT3.18, partial [Tanacetum coccineum]
STKVCWEDGKCSEADILAAFDKAIHDGVNVISVAFRSPPPLVPLLDSSSDIGSFHAMQKGISVVFSSGKI